MPENKPRSAATPDGKLPLFNQRKNNFLKKAIPVPKLENRNPWEYGNAQHLWPIICNRGKPQFGNQKKKLGWGQWGIPGRYWASELVENVWVTGLESKTNTIIRGK